MNKNFSRFMLLWAGELVSAIGSGLTSFGLSVYVFRLTGSAGAMGIVTLLAFLPTMLLGVPAGVLADRYDRRLLMMLGDGLSGLGILYILFCMLTGGATIPQICIGVFISSVFSSLMEPAYRATMTDLLSKEQYAKASGLVSMAGSARYLISPILAGALLVISDIQLLLILDISTFLLTVISTAAVRKAIAAPARTAREPFLSSLKQGWKAITVNRGVLILILVTSIVTCFMGVIQILSAPMILDFADSDTLGVTETLCACGMLVSSLVLGIRGIRKGYLKALCLSLFIAGISMLGFGLKENIVMICIFGFLFFATLPFANSSLDYLVRTNIENGLQGRVWGLIGFHSQLGYVIAYGLAGFAADGAAFAFSIGVGRGAGYIIMAAGVLMCIAAALLYPVKSVKALERTS